MRGMRETLASLYKRLKMKKTAWKEKYYD